MAKNIQKSGWTKKTAGDYNETFKFSKEGDSIEGNYLGSKEIETALGDSIVHTIDCKGIKLDFFGTGKLNFLFRDVKVKEEVKIVYLGKVPAKIKVGKKKINKDIHDFELYTRT